MNTTRIRRENGKRIVSILVLAGSTLSACVQSYEPAPCTRIKGIEKVYIQNNRYNPYKSEERKKEILARINEIRKQMKNIAMSTQHRDKNTVVRPLPAKAKEALRSIESTNILIERIFTV